MTTSRKHRSWLELLLGVVVPSLAGCGAAEDTGDSGSLDPTDNVATDSGELARWGYQRRARPSDGTAGRAGTGGTTGTVSGCEICSKANACCNAVSGGSLCTFSAATCSALRPESQPGYIGACRTLLTTAFRAQTKSGGVAPSSCR